MSKTLAMLTAELAFKSCEKGHNWEYTRAMIVDLLIGPDKPLPLPWRPIAELSEKERHSDEQGFLVLAPELVDDDCNVHGVGMGYFQDDRDVPSDEHGAIREEGVEYGGWLACKWSMSNDEWHEVPCTPTHYLRLRGVTND